MYYAMNISKQVASKLKEYAEEVAAQLPPGIPSQIIMPSKDEIRTKQREDIDICNRSLELLDNVLIVLNDMQEITATFKEAYTK